MTPALTGMRSMPPSSRSAAHNNPHTSAIGDNMRGSAEKKSWYGASKSNQTVHGAVNPLETVSVALRKPRSPPGYGKILAAVR